MAAASASRAENLSWLEADMFIGPFGADDRDMDVTPEARLFIAPVFGICILEDCIIELLFIVMLIKPVVSLFMGGLGMADMGANGSFCTEKSKRLEEAGCEAARMGGAVVVVLYADASPNGSAGAGAAAAKENTEPPCPPWHRVCVCGVLRSGGIACPRAKSAKEAAARG